MDIETLRKIQETEKALRIHNIVSSPQEAIDAVSQDVYVGGTKVPSFTSAPIVSKPIEQPTKEVMQMDNQVSDEIKKTVDEHNELITKQASMIYELQGVVNDIIKEIKKMQTSVPTKNPAERQVVLKPEEKQQHPRSGGYTSDDVSIDKIFNCSGTR